MTILNNSVLHNPNRYRVNPHNPVNPTANVNNVGDRISQTRSPNLRMNPTQTKYNYHPEDFYIHGKRGSINRNMEGREAHLRSLINSKSR